MRSAAIAAALWTSLVFVLGVVTGLQEHAPAAVEPAASDPWQEQCEPRQVGEYYVTVCLRGPEGASVRLSLPAGESKCGDQLEACLGVLHAVLQSQPVCGELL